MTPPTVTEPLVELGPDICGYLDTAVRHEWLVGNGLGGYAFGTVAGVATRVYHGLLVAALSPPVGRTMLVGALAEWATVDGARVALHAHEYADGTIDQHGYRRLVSVRLDGMRPVFTYAIGDVRIEKRIWMADGANTTYVRYESVGADRPIELELTPLTTVRDHHAVGHESRRRPARAAADRRARRQLHAGRPVVPRVPAPRGDRPGARGSIRPVGGRRGAVQPPAGRPATLILHGRAGRAGRARDCARGRDRARRRSAPPGRGSRIVAVRPRPRPGGRPIHRPARHPGRRRCDELGRTVIAGYPWFNDWGRDTMISLPGLCLATGPARRSRHDPALVRTVRARRPAAEQLPGPGRRPARVPHDRRIALVPARRSRPCCRDRLDRSRRRAAADAPVDPGRPPGRNPVRDRDGPGRRAASWRRRRLPADLDGCPGRRLGGHAPARQAGRDPGALDQRAADRRRLARRPRRSRRRRGALPRGRRAGCDGVLSPVLATRARPSRRRRRWPGRRRPGAPPEPAARAVAPPPARRRRDGRCPCSMRWVGPWRCRLGCDRSRRPIRPIARDTRATAGSATRATTRARSGPG